MPAESFLALLLVAVAINTILLIAVGLTAIRIRRRSDERAVGARPGGEVDRPGWPLLDSAGRPSLTYDRVVRVVSWSFILAVSAIVAASGLWPTTQTAIFALMVLAGVFLLVVHEIIPGSVLGSARPIVECSVGITLATLLVVLTGGAGSPFFFAFALIVAGAALVLPPRLTILVTAFAVGGYLVGVLADPERLPLETSAAAAVSVNIAALVLLAYMAMVVARDQRQSRDAAIRMSSVDSLTGLYNRAYFFAAIEREIARSARSRRGFCLLMLDLDGLKPINDRYGHYEGDRVLRGVGDVIRNRVRRIDTAARYGGDEFVVLLPETEPTGAFVLAEKIRTGAERADDRDGVGPDPHLAVDRCRGVPDRRADRRRADDRGRPGDVRVEAAGQEPDRRVPRRRGGPATAGRPRDARRTHPSRATPRSGRDDPLRSAGRAV